MFYLNKIAGALLHPGTLLALCLFTASFLLARHRLGTKWLRGFIHAGSAAAMLLIWTPVADMPLAALERWVPAAELPARVNGIIVLGGWADAIPPTQKHPPNIREGADRLIAGLDLARRYPDAKVLFSGGSGDLIRRDASEAHGVKIILDMIGFPPSRVLLEPDSRDTYENALFSKRLVNPAPGDVWILVTSASHMPRAMGCFRRVEFPVLPYPCDFRADPDATFGFRKFLNSLIRIDAAVYELLGLAGYWASGRVAF